jgi:ATP-dependent Clp protease ATP-binding subunit ClpX
MSENTNSESCSFCGQTKSEVEKLIVGQNVAICDYCVALCYEALKREGIDLQVNKKANPQDRRM